MPARQIDKWLLASAVLIGALFLSPTSSLAIFSFDVKKIDKTSITNKEEEVKVTLVVNDLPSDSYFRVAFQKQSGDPYLGFIKNKKNEWVKIESLSSKNCADYYSLSATASAEITISLIIGSENEPENGSYLIRGHRFTASCSNQISSNFLNLDFSLPQPSPSPTPKSSSDSSSQEPSPTPTPSLSPTPSLLANASASPSAAATFSGEIRLLQTEGNILGASSSSQSAQGKGKLIAWVLIGLGIALLTVSGAIFGYNQLNASKS